MTIKQAEDRLAALQGELANAEEDVRQAKAQAMKEISTGDCPSCGANIHLGAMPTEAGKVQVHGCDCESCDRKFDCHLTWNGGDRYDRNSYRVSMIHRGFVTESLNPDRLTNAQLQREKEFFLELGEAAVPAQKERLNQLLMTQLLRTDAAKLDDIQQTNKSILDLLRAKLGGG